MKRILPFIVLNLLFAGQEVNEIDVSNYPPGLYIIITDDGRRVKFVKFSSGH